MPAEGLLSQIKRLVVGDPIPSHLASHERFSRTTGLAVLSSDPLSSVAYATEEILRVLILVDISALVFAGPIAFVIASILAIVVFSYRQTIHAYPSGGGAYIVARENLGEWPSLFAASALLIDYILTVAVSIAAGVAALTSAFPEWIDYRVPLGLAFLLVLTFGNLRGHSRIGADIRSAHLLLHRQPPRTHRTRRLAGAHRNDRTSGGGRAIDVDRPATHALSRAQGVRQRMHGDDRRRSSVQRRPRLQAAGGPQCGVDDGRDGGAVDHDVRRHHAPGTDLRHHPQQQRNGGIAAGPRRFRRPRRGVFRGSGGDDADTRAGGKHRIRRFPPAGVDTCA